MRAEVRSQDDQLCSELFEPLVARHCPPLVSEPWQSEFLAPSGGRALAHGETASLKRLLVPQANCGDSTARPGCPSLWHNKTALGTLPARRSS